MLGLIRKSELKRILDYLEAVEKNDCDGTKKEQVWLAGSTDVIYGIAGYFGIKLSSMEKKGEHDGKAD